MQKQTLKMLVVAAMLGPALMIAGCKSDGDGGSSSAAGSSTAPATLAQPVTMVESVNGDSSALGFGHMLIRTQAEYDALGDKDIYPGGVDFDKYDLVIVALGERKTGGYKIDITSIQMVGDELAITGKVTTPAPDAATTQALTYPYDAVIIANTDAKTVVPYID